MIGSRLQELLTEKNMTPADLSRLTGVSYQTIISIIKRDNMKVDLSQLAKISDALGVSIEVFYMEYDAYMRRKEQESGLSVSDVDPQIAELLGFANRLNAQGKERLCRYAEELTYVPSYQKKISPMTVKTDTGDQGRLAARGGATAEQEHPADMDAFFKAIKESEPPEKV